MMSAFRELAAECRVHGEAQDAIPNVIGTLTHCFTRSQDDGH
jgi:hypothetical protein